MSTAKHISIWDTRVNLTDFVNRVRYKNERFVIEKHGVPLAMIIPIDSIPTIQPLPDAPALPSPPSSPMSPISPMSKLKVFETGA